MVREIIFIYCDVEKVDVESLEFKNSNPYFGYGLPPFKSKEEEIETEKKEGIKQLSDLLDRLTEELLPVSNKAQRKVKIPEDLDLDTPFTTIMLDVRLIRIEYY